MSSRTMPRRRNDELALVDDDVEDDDEMLPPHEIVARGSGVSPKTTSSVLEGVGRTCWVNVLFSHLIPIRLK
ncbi:hypothetical protein K1719_011014 [Acacia pycnantha]|nr:hypothetical protein K1719_011014 [Acacia pycnantha]